MPAVTPACRQTGLPAVILWVSRAISLSKAGLGQNWCGYGFTKRANELTLTLRYLVQSTREKCPPLRRTSFQRLIQPTARTCGAVIDYRRCSAHGVGLGSAWVDSNGNRNYLYLNHDSDKRNLNLNWDENPFSARCRFPAVCKSLCVLRTSG